MALTLEAASSMAKLAKAHPGQMTILGYNYLRSPAFQAARRMISDDAIGMPVAFRGVYDEDYSVDPLLPWSWRMAHEGGGLGALGDLGCHLVSLITALMGPVTEFTAQTQIVVPSRPSPDGPKSVEKEDSALVLVRFASGAQRSFTTSRVARGRKCRLQWEITPRHDRTSGVDLHGAQIGGRLGDMGSYEKYIGGSPTNIACGSAGTIPAAHRMVSRCTTSTSWRDLCANGASSPHPHVQHLMR